MNPALGNEEKVGMLSDEAVAVEAPAGNSGALDGPGGTAFRPAAAGNSGELVRCPSPVLVLDTCGSACVAGAAGAGARHDEAASDPRSGLRCDADCGVGSTCACNMGHGRVVRQSMQRPAQDGALAARHSHERTAAPNP